MIFKIATIVLCIVTISHAGLLDPIVPPVINLIKAAEGGIQVKIVGDTYQIGVIPLPLALLCSPFIPLLSERFLCHLCNSDCFAVHNKYGGQCGRDHVRGNAICLCDDAPKPNGFYKTPEERCGPLLLTDLPPTWLVTGAFDTVTVVREDALQCIAQSVGCDVDCTHNHQYNDGACVITSGVPRYPGDINPPQNYCECNY